MTDSKPPIELEELPSLPEEEEEAYARALLAAWSPSELDPGVNEALIAAALEDPLAPPTEDEIAESERLRLALDGEGHHPGADLARALRAAAAPGKLGETETAQIVEDALSTSPRIRRGNVIFVSFGAAGAAIAALAASWFLFVRPALETEGGQALVPEADLAVSRSTAALFSEKFDTAETTSRVDRIVSARSRELRSNRYALWGVR